MKTQHIILLLACLFFIGCKESLIGDPKMMSKVNVLPNLNKAGTFEVSSMTITTNFIQKKPLVVNEEINFDIKFQFGSDYPFGSEVTKTLRKYDKKGNIELEETEIIKPLIKMKAGLSIGYILSISSTIGLIMILLIKFVEFIISKFKNRRVKNGR